MGVERMIVRLGIPLLLVGSGAGAVAVSLHAAEIPSLAFGSRPVLAVQVALVFFYGALLLLVPLVRALFDGDLPIELSLRGARWREDAVGFGGELLAGQDAAEERAAKASLEVKEEIQLLKDQMRDDARAGDVLVGRVLERIRVVEKEIGIGESGR